jgi:bacterioferritin-associated ferredoxin
MVVCLCKGVSDKTIRWHVQNGQKSLRDVMRACNAGSDCGSCVCQVRALIDATIAEDRVTCEKDDSAAG